MRGLAVLLVALLTLAAAVAEAQRTGGRFGGSRFGSRSSSSSRSSGSYRSSRSSSWGRSSSASRRSSTRSASRSTSSSASPSYPSTPPPPPSREQLAAGGAFRADHIPAPPSPEERAHGRIGAYEAPGPARMPPQAELWVATAIRPGPPRWGLAGGVAAGAFAFFGLFALGIRNYRRDAAERARSRAKRPASPATGARSACDVRRVSIAFDWSRRRALQEGLERLAATHDTGSQSGLWRGAVAVRDLLLEATSGARYASFSRFRLDEQQAEARFQMLELNARARFTAETVDNARRSIAEGLVARPEEGDGLVVVTFLVAAGAPLPELPEQISVDAVVHALGTIVPSTSSALLAMSVVWSPSEENDRMSSAELEVLYPELTRLDDSPKIGRRVCSYCRTPHPAELGKCPGCGSPG